MLSCRNSRLVELQDWPCQVKFIAETAASATCSTDASGKTTNGFFPPSSRETVLTATSAAERWIAIPVRTDPTNESRLTCGLRTRASPTSRSPVTMLSSPRGSTSCAISAKRAVDSEHSSDGFTTIELPAMSGAATPWIAIAAGWLKATIRPTTP
jgi:hypothetical protein